MPEYVAVTVVLALGMVSVVEVDVGLATAAPTQLSNFAPWGGEFAVILMLVPGE